MSANPYRPPYSFAEVLHRLGDVPADRVRFKPMPGTAVLNDLLEPENSRCELVDGTLVEKTVGVEESMLAMSLGIEIGMFVRAGNLGVVTGEQGFYQLPDGPVRGPDITFVSWERMPGRRRDQEPIPTRSPDLVVEILSVSNARREMARKRVEYFAAGVTLVWEIDPRARWVRVYTAPETFTELTAADTLAGDPVLPGFMLELADLFAELDRHG